MYIICSDSKLRSLPDIQFLQQFWWKNKYNKLHIICTTTSKNNCIKLKVKVGMAVPKSTQTRLVGRITYMVHPYACFLVMVHIYRYMCSSSLAIGYIWASLATRWSEWKKGAAWSVFHRSLITWKASIGTYHVCDSPYHSCLNTIWHRHPYFTLQFLCNCFYTCYHYFFSRLHS